MNRFLERNLTRGPTPSRHEVRLRGHRHTAASRPTAARAPDETQQPPHCRWCQQTGAGRGVLPRAAGGGGFWTSCGGTATPAQGTRKLRLLKLGTVRQERAQHGRGDGAGQVGPLSGLRAVGGEGASGRGPGVSCRCALLPGLPLSWVPQRFGDCAVGGGSREGRAQTHPQREASAAPFVLRLLSQGGV